MLGERALNMAGVEEGHKFRFRRDLYSPESTFPLVVKIISCHQYCCLQCFDTVGWAAGKASGPLPFNKRLMFTVSRINPYHKFILSENCHFFTTCIFTGHTVQM